MQNSERRACPIVSTVLVLIILSSVFKHGAQCFIYAISFNPYNNHLSYRFAFRICLTDAKIVPHRG